MHKFSRKGVGLSALLLVFALGVFLRTYHYWDFTYEGDQKHTYVMSNDFLSHGGEFPWTGMPSSASTASPGFEIWGFLVPMWIFHLYSPAKLTAFVVVLQLLALALMLALARRKEDGTLWFWAAALFAANPVYVYWGRDIWPQCLLPLYCMGFFLAWQEKSKPWGAFAWGILGGTLGQLHMTGFFLAIVFIVYAFARERKQVKWIPAVGGASLSALMLIPWVKTVLEDRVVHPTRLHGLEVLQLRYIRAVMTDALGNRVNYVLDKHFQGLFELPFVSGTATHLVRAATLTLDAALGVILLSAAWSLWKSKKDALTNSLQDSPALRYSAISLAGLFVIYSAMGLFIERHYLLILFPTTFILLAWLAFLGLREHAPKLLAGIVILQAFVTFEMLSFIHDHRTEHLGVYGVPYSGQNHSYDDHF